MQFGDYSHTSFQELQALYQQYYQSGHFEKALFFVNEAFKKAKKQFEDSHPIMISLLNSRMMIEKNLGKYQEALEDGLLCYKKCLEAFGEDSMNTMNCLCNLSMLYINLGQYDKALLSLRQSLEKCEKIYGLDHPQTLILKNQLAGLYLELGDFKNAEKLFETVYQKRLALLGENHQDTLVTKHNLATVYEHTGKYEEALLFGNEVVEGMSIVLGKTHPLTLRALSNLASIYNGIGMSHLALDCFKRVFFQTQLKFGQNHPDTLTALNNLAMTYAKLGEFDQALPYMQDCFQKRSQSLGENHPDTIMTLNNIATIYHYFNDLENAKKYYLQCFEKCKEAWGMAHHYTLIVLNNLASISQSVISVEDMQIAYEMSKETYGEDHLTTLHLYARIGMKYDHLKQYDQALKIEKECLFKAESVYGKYHSVTLSILDNLGNIYREMGDQTQYLNYVRVSYQRTLESLGSAHPHTLSRLSHLLKIVENDDERYAYAKMFLNQSIIFFKNTSVIKERHILIQYFKELIEVYGIFITSLFSGEKNKEDYELALRFKNIIYDIEYEKRKKSRLDTKYFGKKFYEKLRQITLVKIQDALLENEVIIDYYCIDEKNDIYGVFVIGKTLFLMLSDSNLEFQIIQHLKPNQHLYICPDGNLYQTSFEEIFKHQDVSYLSSPKSILWANKEKSQGESVSMICPEFFLESDDESYEKADIKNKLYGGYIEEKYLKKYMGNVQSYKRKEANHDNFLEITSPPILHISTHGGFLDGHSENPMTKGILYLSGYNHAEMVDQCYGNGYVTANEIQFMNLSGCDLVVLSACLTAAGQVNIGEGIYGLRRAFELAGAKSLLLTLEKVDDFNSAIFMKIFYRFYKEERNAYQALKKAKQYLKESSYLDKNRDYHNKNMEAYYTFEKQMNNSIKALIELKEDYYEIFEGKISKYDFNLLKKQLNRRIQTSMACGYLVKGNKETKETWTEFIIQGREG